MEKLVYLVWAPEGAACHELSERLRSDVAPRLRELGPAALQMNLNDADADVPPPVPPPPGEDPLAAEVAFWLDCHDRRGPFEEVLSGLGRPFAGYLVTESLYTDYGGNRHAGPRDWPDGTRSPGVLTVTLLEKPDRLSDAEWYAHWYGVQSPVSEAIQPRTRYVRNAVARPLTEGAPPLRGIVDEAWPSPEHIRDPMLFYLAEGSPERLRENVERMLESVRGFLDLERIRSATMSEYLLLT